MDTLCFSTFMNTLRPCLEGPISNTNLAIKLLQPIIDCDNSVNKTGEPLIIDTDITSKWMTRKRDIYNPIKSALNKQKVVNVIKDTFANDIFDSFDVGKEQDFYENLHKLINEDSTITDIKKNGFLDFSIPAADRVTNIFIHALQAENKTEDRGWKTQLYRDDIESELKTVLDKLSNEKRKEIKKNELNMTPTSFRKKIKEDNHELIDKVEFNVIYYFVIRNYFKELEARHDANFNKVAKHIRKNYMGLKKAGQSQDQIHDNLTDMIASKSGANRNTCEKIVAFFIQDCEVYDEITE